MTSSAVSPAVGASSDNLPAAGKPERLVSLDVFRGLTIAGMILVTDPGTYSAVYWPLLHASWNGWTLTDMIFPSFLFIIGMAMTFSFAARTARGESRGRIAIHLLQRATILIVLGLIVNGFPYFNLHTLRIPGVLQRIALCYLCGGLIYLATLSAPLPGISAGKTGSKPSGKFVLITVTVAIVALYWAILKLVPVPGFGAGRLDSLGNLGAVIDRAVFGTRHMWAYGLTPGYGVTFDPEGLLSTLPAIATLLVGILAGMKLRDNTSDNTLKTRTMFIFAAIGIVLLLAGWLLNSLLPINKKSWTSTFVFLSSGFSLVAFALCYWVVDILRRRWWITPALIFGTNAIFAFVLSGVLTSLSNVIRVHTFHPATTNGLLTLHQWGYFRLFLPWLSPVHASLAYAISVVLLNMALVYPLYRKRIFLKI